MHLTAMNVASQANAPDEVAHDLVDMLLRCPAFADVDRMALARVVRGASLRYAAADAGVPDLDSPFVVQRGALMVYDAQGRTTDLIAAEEFHQPNAGERMQALDGTLILILPPWAADIAWSQSPRAILAATAPGAPQIDLQTTPVGQLMGQEELVTAQAEETCRAVAERMTAHNVSSVVILGRDEPGIVTDRDLRIRLVAVGGSVEDPVGSIATFPVRTTPAGTPVFSALIEMLSTGTHHLPVTDGGRLIGMVTSSDLLKLQTRSPLHLRTALDRARTVEECAAAMGGLPETVRALRAAGTTPTQVSAVLATVADRCATRLLALATDVLGPAPAPYGWVAFGSQARREVSLGSDQDTGLIIADGLEADAHDWFARLGTWVTAGLEQCGYPRCHGGVMASEAQWRHDISGWRQRFSRWISTPSEAHVMGAEIAFDVRTVAGEIDAADVIAPVIRQAADHGIFLGRLGLQAISHRPPLGFRGRLTVDRSGAHAGTLDLKGGALMPIVDIARLHTLARGGSEVSTTDRLHAAAAARVLSRDLAATLAAGHELALGIRLDRAVAQLDTGLPPSNRVDPTALPALVRSQLKETFKAVRTAQESIQSTYQLIDN
ncbi:MAG TPA: DUF294 nucleotidyltransferase-like domain-containing protein [Euzebya sp.]|nr:DUF294 nucleotidyltransferase-like domain-containing protein [Euzebya sp.]